MIARTKIGRDPQAARKHNLASVLALLRSRQGMSRAGLAKKLGLSRGGITRIVQDLLDEGMVLETSERTIQQGRPGIVLGLNPQYCNAIGIDLAHSLISVVVVDMVATPIWHREIAIDPQASTGSYLQIAEQLIEEALGEVRARKLRCPGIGAGFSGLVDAEQGRLVMSTHLHLNDVPIRQMWEARFGLPVFVENSGRGAALAEYLFGDSCNAQSMVFLVGSGSGVGAGIIINGRLFRGHDGMAGEVGHIQVALEGELCSCGQHGCWETLVGASSIIRRVRRRLDQSASSVIRDQITRPEHLDLDLVLKAAGEGDEVALEALNETGYYLGVGIANLFKLYNPEEVVLGGYLTWLHPFVMPAIEKVLAGDRVLAHSRARVTVSRFGVHSRPIGAAALVLNRALDNPEIRKNHLKAT